MAKLPIASDCSCWSGECSFHGPTCAKAILNHRMMHTKLCCPISKYLSLASERDVAICLFVAILFVCRRPSTISWLVSFVVVFALDSVIAGRAIPHVGEKSLKAVAPSLADGYTARSVFSIRRVIGIQASSFNASPYFIFRCPSQSMNSLVLPAPLAKQAPTTKRFLSGKIPGEHIVFSSAIASTKPIAFASVADDRPPAKAHSGQVFDIMMEGRHYA